MVSKGLKYDNVSALWNEIFTKKYTNFLPNMLKILKKGSNVDILSQCMMPTLVVPIPVYQSSNTMFFYFLPVIFFRDPHLLSRPSKYVESKDIFRHLWFINVPQQAKSSKILKMPYLDPSIMLSNETLKF